MMSRASRMLKWVGAGAVLLAAAPIAYADEPSAAASSHAKRVSVHGAAPAVDAEHPPFHTACIFCHLTVPHSTKAQRKVTQEHDCGHGRGHGLATRRD